MSWIIAGAGPGDRTRCYAIRKWKTGFVWTFGRDQATKFETKELAHEAMIAEILLEGSIGDAVAEEL